MKHAFFALAVIAAVVLGWRGDAAAESMADHKIAIHVDDNDPARMNVALNNAANMARYYASQNQTVDIRIVAYGAGLTMFRADTSPVADRVKSMGESMPNVSFAACGNTVANVTKKEGKAPPMLAGVTVVPSGVVELVKLQEEGWSYVRP